MSYAPKNYSTDGGNKTVIGGELEIKEGARVSVPSDLNPFIVFNLQGANVSPATVDGMNVTEYVSLEQFDEAVNGGRPVLVKGCGIFNKVFSAVGFAVGMPDDGDTGDAVIVGLCGYPQSNGTADLVTIITVMFYRTSNAVILRISPNEKLLQILNPALPVSGVSISESAKTVAANETFSLTATVEPFDADNPAVQWSTSDGETVSILSGEYENTVSLEAVGVGTATITVTTDDGGHTANCVVTVTGES